MKPEWRQPPRRTGPIETLSEEAQRLRDRVNASTLLATFLFLLLATGVI